MDTRQDLHKIERPDHAMKDERMQGLQSLLKIYLQNFRGKQKWIKSAVVYHIGQVSAKVIAKNKLSHRKQEAAMPSHLSNKKQERVAQFQRANHSVLRRTGFQLFQLQQLN